MGMYTCICGGLVKVICFVLDDSRLTGDQKSVGEASGDEELEVVLRRQTDGDVPSQRGRVRTDVNGNIEDLALNDADELSLGMRCFLEM